MQYSVEEIKQYAAEEDVKFIRMAFCDAAGRQKNIAIMPEVRYCHRRLRHSRLRRGGPL